MIFTLHTDAFFPGGNIPQKYTCEGANVSPPLTWTGAPSGTQSFMLTCDDPDAPSGVFQHWAIYDIPAAWIKLEEGGAARPPLREGINDFGKTGYGGPCPPLGHGPHRYRFRLYALSSETLPLAAPALCTKIASVARPFILTWAEIIATFERLRPDAGRSATGQRPSVHKAPAN